MDVTLRILHTDGSITTKQVTGVKFPDNWNDSVSVSSAIAIIGSKMRKKDATIAAIRNDKNNGTWVGHQNRCQSDAKIKSERENPKW